MKTHITVFTCPCSRQSEWTSMGNNTREASMSSIFNTVPLSYSSSQPFLVTQHYGCLCGHSNANLSQCLVPHIQIIDYHTQHLREQGNNSNASDMENLFSGLSPYIG